MALLHKKTPEHSFLQRSRTHFPWTRYQEQQKQYISLENKQFNTDFDNANIQEEDIGHYLEVNADTILKGKLTAVIMMLAGTGEV